MNYHLIKKDDINNGDGIRVTLFLSSCDHHCKGCHNPQTWDKDTGELFDDNAKNELLDYLSKDYISGLTLSGGDPLNKHNLDGVLELCKEVKETYKNKTIWIYSGYTYEQTLKNEKMLNILKLCDVLVDGKFIEELADVNYHWAGSSNQRVIDIQKSLNKGEVIELEL